MDCPYCEVNLEEKIDSGRHEDHDMVCPFCGNDVYVCHDTYLEGIDEKVIDIFWLIKKGDA